MVIAVIPPCTSALPRRERGRGTRLLGSVQRAPLNGDVVRSSTPGSTPLGSSVGGSSWDDLDEKAAVSARASAQLGRLLPASCSHWYTSERATYISNGGVSTTKCDSWCFWSAPYAQTCDYRTI